MYCIILADRPHGSWKWSTWKRVSGWKNPKMQPSYSPVDSESTYIQNDNAIAPPLDLLPLTSEHRDVSEQQQQLRTTCSCSCCRRYSAFLATYSPCRHCLFVDTNNSGFLARAIFIFWLCSVSPSTVCLFTARKLNAHAPSLLLRFLVNVKCHQEAWNMNYSIFGRFQWIRMDAYILETMPKKTGKNDHYRPCGRPLCTEIATSLQDWKQRFDIVALIWGHSFSLSTNFQVGVDL